MKMRFLFIYALVLAAAVLMNTLHGGAAPQMKPLVEFPAAFGDWRMTSQDEFSRDVVDVLKPTDYLSRSYRNSAGDQVRLYIGYHDGGERSGPIHSPKHCLPGSGWNRVSEEPRQIAAGNRNVNLVQGMYQKGATQELFVYWFQLGEKSVTSEYWLKYSQLYHSITKGRREATFVRIAVPVAGNKDLAARTASQFVGDFYPAFLGYVPL